MSSFERISQPRIPDIKPPVSLEKSRHEHEPRVERIVCLSDIHNDLVAVQASLRQQNIIDAYGKWKHPVNLIITGDSINRHEPNPEVLKYFAHLQETVPEGYAVTMLVGNHELDILVHVADGEDAGLKDKRIKFLGSMDVVCKRGPVLYLHRYPSLGLVRELWQQYTEQNGNPTVWNINRRFHEAVSTLQVTPERSKAIFRECDDGGDHGALGGLSPEAYYQKYGVLIGRFLKEMGVTTIVHGHKIQKEGGQKFEQYIQSVFMVNNDVGISSAKNPEHHHRIGLIEIASASDAGVEITCRYKPNIKQNGKTKIQVATIH